MPFNGAGILSVKAPGAQSITSPAHPLAVFGPMCIGVVKQVTAFAMSFIASGIATFSSSIFSVAGTLRQPALLNYFFIRKATLVTIDNSIQLYAINFSKLYCFVIFTFNTKMYRAAPIALLFFTRSPFAIFFAVAQGIIFALKQKTLGARPHVLGKLVKVIAPFFAHLYSAPAIILVLFSGLTVTSAAHRLPHHVKVWWLPLLFAHESPFKLNGRQNQVGG